jgi:hypothetical protein
LLAPAPRVGQRRARAGELELGVRAVDLGHAARLEARAGDAQLVGAQLDRALEQRDLGVERAHLEVVRGDVGREREQDVAVVGDGRLRARSGGLERAPHAAPQSRPRSSGRAGCCRSRGGPPAR